MQVENNQIIEMPHDVVSLPSKGLYYPSKKSQIKVSYLTASDENLLTSANLIESGEMLDMLLDRKVLDKDIRPSNMLDGDRIAVLFFLRATGYGAIFPLKMTDPVTRKPFDYDVDLTTLQYKEDLLIPDEKGLCEFTFPSTNKKVKFRFLSGGEIQKLVKDDEDRQARLGKKAYSMLMTNKLVAQVEEIDGITDKEQIRQYIEYMPVKDSAELRKFINEHEPGIDLRIEVTAPSGNRFQSKIGITAEFFWPYL